MDLFIGNLPSKVHFSEVIALFRGFTRMGRFRLEQKRLDNGKSVSFVVAEFDNDKHAIKLLQKFQGTVYRGRELVIREYHHRSYSNERRAVNWREKPWRAGERRRTDRRMREMLPESLREPPQIGGKSEEPRAETPKIEAYSDFARKG